MIPLRDRNPSHTLALVTGLLIVANSLLFIYELTLGADLERFLFSAACCRETRMPNSKI